MWARAARTPACWLPAESYLRTTLLAVSSGTISLVETSTEENSPKLEGHSGSGDLRQGQMPLFRHLYGWVSLGISGYP